MTTLRDRLPLLLAFALAVACGDARQPTATGPDEALFRRGAPAQPADHWHAILRGGAEVPAVQTRSRGQAQFWLADDGASIRYRLNVANLEDVLMAHIHLAPPGDNGSVVAWLYPEDGPPEQLIPGRTSGVLATGTITESDLVGPLAGDPFSDLIDAIEAGNTYVNVHTSAHPGGEIRGQIR